MKLSWQVGLLDPGRIPVEPPKTGRLDESLRFQDKDWVPKFVVSFLLRRPSRGDVLRLGGTILVTVGLIVACGYANRFSATVSFGFRHGPRLTTRLQDGAEDGASGLVRGAPVA